MTSASRHVEDRWGEGGTVEQCDKTLLEQVALWAAVENGNDQWGKIRKNQR